MTSYKQAYEFLDTNKSGVSRLGWNSKNEQWMRFNQIDILLKAYFEKIEELSIHDVGCGYGDLLNFWKDSPPKEYIGTDVMESFIDAAKEKYPHGQFSVLDALRENPPKADVSVLCGTLAFHDINSKAIIMTRVAEASERAVVFTDWTGPVFGDKWYLEERRFLTYVQSLGAKLIRNTNLYDFSEHMYILLK